MIDFNNDALDLLGYGLALLVGEDVTINGCLPDGTDYMNGKLVGVVSSDDGAIIQVQRYTDDDYDGTGRASGEVVRLHAPQQAHRIRICR